MSELQPMRTPLRQVRGLGTARSGTGHFWHQRVTSVAGVPLTIALLMIITALLGRSHAAVVQILGSPIVAIVMLLFIGWALRNLQVGRSLYAVGSDEEAARLAGIEPKRVVFGVFTVTGALVGLAAMLNAVRFNAVPSNAGLGLELTAVAAVVVGGTAITGGRGTVLGTLIGVLLLGTIGTAMTYVGISPFWAKAIQGLIILAALVADAALARFERHGSLFGRRTVAAR